jgi:hypothetical protein
MKQLNPISDSPLSDIKIVELKNTIAHTHRQKEIFSLFAKKLKFLRKLCKNEHFVKNGTGSENAMKHSNSKRQINF